MNKQYSSGRALLHALVYTEDVGIVQSALEAGATVNIQDGEGTTALHLAARLGNTAVVLALLEKGAIINHPDNRERTALHFASFYKQTEAVLVLLARGATINQPDNNGRTALHYAIGSGHLETVLALLKNGATINHQDNSGSTALHFAASTLLDYKNEGLKIALLLLNAGDQTTLKNERGETALEHVCNSENIEKRNSTLAVLLDNFPRLLAKEKSVFACSYSFFSNKESTPISYRMPDDVNCLIQQYLGINVLEEDIEDFTKNPQKGVGAMP